MTCETSGYWSGGCNNGLYGYGGLGYGAGLYGYGGGYGACGLGGYGACGLGGYGGCGLLGGYGGCGINSYYPYYACSLPCFNQCYPYWGCGSILYPGYGNAYFPSCLSGSYFPWYNQNCQTYTVGKRCKVTCN